MKLNAQQAKQFLEEGWLFLPDCFSPEEVEVLRTEAEGIYKVDRPQVWREKSGAPRTAFAAHTYNEGFGILGRHPRLIEPVEQLFGDKLYMHQFKINAKAKFDGDVWQWHQDYGTWARDDGMPEPKAMNISVFLDEVFTVQRPADDYPHGATSTACWRRVTTSRRRATRCGRSIMRRWRSWSMKAGWWCRPASRAAC